MRTFAPPVLLAPTFAHWLRSIADAIRAFVAWMDEPERCQGCGGTAIDTADVVYLAPRYEPRRHERCRACGYERLA